MFSCTATWLVTLTSLAQDDLRNLCTHGVSTRAKKKIAALLATAEPGQRNIHLIHAEDDTLCDWHPSPIDLYVISHRLTCTLVAESADGWVQASISTRTAPTSVGSQT